MKILFVVPRYSLTNKKDHGYLFPIGLGYISSSIKKAGHEVECLNLNHFDGTTEEIITNALDAKKYDCVCSGHTGIGYAIIEKIIKASHNHSTSPKVIIGGALITSEPELMLESLKPDFIVIGEGEKTIVELLDSIGNNGDLKKVNGIGYIDNGKPVFTPPREPIPDLDSLPIPDFDGFGFEEKLENTCSSEVLSSALDYPRPYPILGSRSCPFQCTFCYHSVGSKYRTRSIDNIIKEIESAIKKYKINCVILYDDLLSVDKVRVMEFCKRMKKIKNNLPDDFKWSCQLWVTTVGAELLGVLKESGCVLVGMGFESYSPVVLKSMKKYITPEQIDNAINACYNAGMPITGGFIFGDVAETKETAKETLDYWRNHGDGQLQLGFIQPYPGSAGG